LCSYKGKGNLPVAHRNRSATAPQPLQVSFFEVLVLKKRDWLRGCAKNMPAYVGRGKKRPPPFPQYQTRPGQSAQPRNRGRQQVQTGLRSGAGRAQPKRLFAIWENDV
jgi:hypothetical protein